MYKVIVRFMDLQDNSHVYEIGDVYPREGLEPTLGRIRELAGKNNKIGVPLIEEEAPKPKPRKRKKAE